MTPDTSTAAPAITREEAHIREIAALFDTFKTTVLRQLGFLSEGDLSMGKAALKKLEELQSLQLSLLKAEEAFHEKFGGPEKGPVIDHDLMRAQIGGQLDRLRRSQTAGAVFKSARK